MMSDCGWSQPAATGGIRQNIAAGLDAAAGVTMEVVVVLSHRGMETSDWSLVTNFSHIRRSSLAFQLPG